MGLGVGLHGEVDERVGQQYSLNRFKQTTNTTQPAENARPKTATEARCTRGCAIRGRSRQTQGKRWGAAILSTARKKGDLNRDLHGEVDERVRQQASLNHNTKAEEGQASNKNGSMTNRRARE
jgi:hypothetical protein